jgi:tellurite resistance protein
MKRRLLLTLALVLAICSLSALAWGRAGGGESYSGGSSTSSRSSSSRSSSSSSSHRSGSSHGYRSSSASLDGPELVFACCGVCLFVLFAAVVGAVQTFVGKKATRQTKAAVRTLDQGRAATARQPPEKIQKALAAIAVRDPGFNEQELVESLEKAFLEVQQAWGERDLDLARRYLSDGVLRRFGVQLALDAFHGKRNACAGAEVTSRKIVAVESDDEFDTVHVRFKARMRDVTVPAQLPEREVQSRLASAPASEFTEYWSFVRRPNPGARSGKLSEGKCPSCGAPVARTATATCEYCQAILNSGSYDWVLSEITQEGELQLAGAGSVEGFARLKGIDPALNRQVLEDRANLIFWKWIEAQATGEPARFKRHCVPQTLAHLQGIEGKPSAGLAQTAVGGVDLLLLESDAEYERAWLRIRWSTAGAGAGIVRTNILQMARRAGLKTHAKSGMATDRCHSCAAPQSSADAVECSFCGATLSHDWAFVELLSPEAFQARKLASRQEPGGLADQFGNVLDPWERRRALTAMVAAARADGLVTGEEHRLLQSCAERWSIEPAMLKALLAAPLDQLSDLQPKSLEEARLLFRALVTAALVDGQIDKTEKLLLEKMAAHLKIQPQESVAIVAELSRNSGPAVG